LSALFCTEAHKEIYCLRSMRTVRSE